MARTTSTPDNGDRDNVWNVRQQSHQHRSPEDIPLYVQTGTCNEGCMSYKKDYSFVETDENDKCK
jgi:hypothetical protein